MEFRIADTFTDSLARLTGDEQKAVKTTAFDLQLNPVNPGMSFHKLDRARDRNFWSVRVSRDIRLIVHRSDDSLLLCYVDRHDKAYDWAEKRKLETHPSTGAAQLVEIRETVKEIVVPVYVHSGIAAKAPTSPVAPAVLGSRTDDELLGYGVPREWLADVKAATEESLLNVAAHLPAEAAEVEHDFSGAARVSGSAGTGKTVVALHRAAFLARKHPEARILLTTYSDTLASALQTKLRRLLGDAPRLGERIDVHSLDAIGLRLYRAHVGEVSLASENEMRELIDEAARAVPGHKFGLQFIRSEWEQVVDAWQLSDWPSYRDVARLGRKTRLPEAQREILWKIFERANDALKARGLVTRARLFTALASAFAGSKHSIFDFIVVDEAQDLAVAHLRFLASLGGNPPNALFFAGDLGQRIFQQPFSWKSLGVDIRGRSRTLRVNYRTSHQIRSQADRLLGAALSDVDGNAEDRSDTVSVFNGPSPAIETFDSGDDESKVVGRWIAQRLAAGVAPHEIAVFVRSDDQLDRARMAMEEAGIAFRVLDERVATASGQACVGTMHLAKGLEFRAVAVMACDDEVIPLQSRINAIGDDADLKEVYDTERHLLYVACTRARDVLLVTGVEPASEFLDDLRTSSAASYNAG